MTTKTKLGIYMVEAYSKITAGILIHVSPLLIYESGRRERKRERARCRQEGNERKKELIRERERERKRES